VKVFEFIQAEKAHHHVRTLCRLLGVSRSGFYAWSSRPPSRHDVEDERLSRSIRRIHESSRRTYGAPRIHAELVFDGVAISRKRVARLMRQAQLSGLHRPRRTRTTLRGLDLAPAPDLVERNFSPQGPDRIWVADITYIRTWEGWLYLAAVMDLYSRKIVGWSMASHLRTELVADALDMAIVRRRPAPGLVHHSDRGCQYTSLGFGRKLRESGILPSMGAVGTAYDNAVAESFFATFKKDLIHRSPWPTRDGAKLATFDYIEVFYNRQRRHSTLGQISPAAFEEMRDAMSV
jgi:putative transposase